MDIYLLSLVAATVIWVLLKVWVLSPKAQSQRSRQVQAVRRKSSPYAGVKIISAADSCACAKQLDGQNYLAREAPVLPLPDCDQSECHCRYKHLPDRREGDRRSPVLLAQGDFFGAEALVPRQGRGRRATD
jgi:hypothetical protein